eukprot:TRINITY_DN5099_c0_g3_i1.p2 TRINITY_DN5099_c0_g3~~TRINITY_DN5099_c0_g3_i1.p2  ORF type:complete len:155 (-),score=30.18 TRINITY_DN5099_c0_g3_i1:656-1120(-)
MDQKDKKWLVRSNIVGTLSRACLSPCAQADKNTEALQMAKSAISVLYYASTVTSKKEMNFAEKLEQKNLRSRIIQWGGFAALIYVDRTCHVEAIREHCKSLELNQYLRGKKLKLTIRSLKAYLRLNVIESKRTLPEVKSSEEQNEMLLFQEYSC